MRTTVTAPAKPAWYIVDAAGERLGRLAARIAYVLNGKHKVAWNPHTLQCDHVIVINAGNLVLEGKKSEKKIYIRHSGFLGHIKRTPFKSLFAAKPAKVLEIAIRGMLPRNRLRSKKMSHLHVFAESSHSHEAQKPIILSSIATPRS